MIAASRYGQPARRGDRLLAIVLVALVHVGLATALLSGFTVRIDRAAESPLGLIDVRLPPPPPPPPPPTVRSVSRREAALRTVPAPKGGATAPTKIKQSAAVQPVPKIVLPVPKLASGGGTSGQGGPSAGAGVGGGLGGNGDGDGSGGGGRELYQIAGAIGAADYPKALRNQGIGGRVGVLFTVAPNGRVSRCAVTRSSGVSELDQLTCRLIQQRFVYRPSTDRSGRPIADEVEGEHLWSARVSRD